MQVIKLRISRDPGKDERRIVTFFLGDHAAPNLENAGEIRVCEHEWMALARLLTAGARAVPGARLVIENEFGRAFVVSS